jgi:hypothetical protein
MYGILRCVECDTVFTYLISKPESERQGDNRKG